MPLKTTTVQHVYEVTFRFMSDRPLEQDTLSDIASDIASGPPREGERRHQVMIREMCFERSDDDREYCMMTEGHRGEHEGPSGRRWGSGR